MYCLIAALCCLTFVSAQKTDSLRYFPAQISLVYPVGTNGVQSKNFSYYFSLNSLIGKVGGLSGMEVSGLCGTVENSAVGFQVAGLSNIVGDGMSGMHIAGVVNIVGDGMVGMQTAGIINIVGDRMVGMQSAGFANIVGDCAKGAQVSGVANVVGDKMKGVQISGVYNCAKTLQGLQIGILSINDTIESGGSLSLINIVKNGAYKEWGLSFADYNNVALSFKMGTPKLYTIYSAGVNIFEDHLWVLGIGFGHRTPIGKKFDFQPECVYNHYFPTDFKNIQYTTATHLKIGFVYRLNEKFGFSLAPSIYLLNANKGKHSNSEFYKTSSFCSLYTHNSNRSQTKIGFGISVGLNINISE